MTDLSRIYDISIDKIEISEHNVRDTQPAKDVDELAASIEKHGLLQPVVLLGARTDPPPYKLIIGSRRFLAHRDLLAQKDERWRMVRAIFAGPIDRVQACVRSLAENMQRVDLNHADAAKAITELYVHYGHDDSRVAEETGMSLRRVRQYIYIEELASGRMKEKLRRGEVTPADVKRVLEAAQGNIRKAEGLLDLMTQYKLTGHEKKRVVEYGTTHPDADADDIVTEARRPRVEQVIAVSLSKAMQAALELAVEALSMGPEEVAAQALTEWLSDQGFLG
jgi:ParB/RepB/Spo0J family partition protein